MKNNNKRSKLGWKIGGACLAAVICVAGIGV